MNKSTSIIIILLALGIFYTFTTSQYSKAKILSVEASEYREVIKNVSRIAEARDNLVSSYKSIPASEKERLKKVLPPNVDSVGLAKDLDAIASQYGISIKSLEIKSGDSGSERNVILPQYRPPYEKVKASFSFISDYQNFRKFLSDIERSLRLMDVSSVSFQVGEGGLYEHNITVETYWLREN